MDMTDLRPDLHVAQQSRREKLRVQQMNDFSNTWDNTFVAYHQYHHQNQYGISPDLIHVRNIRNAGSPLDQALFPSGLVGLSQNQIAMPVQTDVILAYPDCTAMLMNMPQSMPSSAAIAAIKDGSDPQGCSNWKPVDSSLLSCDNWSVMNYGSDQAGRANNNVGEVLSNNVNVVRNEFLDRSLHCWKPHYDAGQDVARSSMTSSEISSQDDNQRCHMNQPYQNSLQNVVTVARSGTRNSVSESTYGHTSWSGNSRGELVFLPSYGNQRPDPWLGRTVGNNVNQWTCDAGFNVTRQYDEESRNFPAASVKQGLSLSLSPEIPRPSTASKSSGKLIEDAVGGGATAASVNVQRQVGPLGPFTGYATILKSSRFLKPARELLDDFCDKCVSKIASRCEASMELANTAAEEDGGGKDNDDSGMLSSTLQSCNEIGSCSTYEMFKPENREKKAKLLFLLEEVCRRYKLYNQQMQMVMSSFESVAGLSTATPYISLALKRISRNFRSLRTAISDQLKHISKSLGDDYVGNSTSNIRCTDRNNNNNNSFQKPRSLMSNNIVFLDPQQQQHVWRPQRGLPERAVAILRAWLFDHFLHPYPTDTDKQMLATQTGLSRNQVSNWFINARVRVWKPMVEEIHMLETRAMAGEARQQNVTRTKLANNIEPLDRPCNNLDQQEPNKQVMEFTGTGSTNNAAVLDHQKRSRVELTHGNNTDVSGLMGFMPYNQRNSGFERGIGSVSLTLGLRNGVDNFQSQSQSQSQSQGNQFGGGQMMVHDFVG